MNKLTGFSALLASSLIFSSFGFFVRYLSPVLSSSQQIYYRYTLGSVLIFIYIYLKDKKFAYKRYLNYKVLLFGLIMPVSFFIFNLTLLHAKLSVGISGYYIGVLVISLIINGLFYNEKINIYGILSLLFCLAGFWFLAGGAFSAFINLGLFYGVLSGSLYGIGNFFKKYLKEFSKMDLLFIISIFNSVVMFGYSMLKGESLRTLDFKMFLIVIGFLCAGLLAEYLTIVGFRNFNLYIGSIILSLEIFFSGLLGYFMYHEGLTVFELIGGIMVILAVIVSNVKKASTQ